MLDHKRDNLKAWLILIIPMALLIIFTLYPLVKTVMIAFNPQYNANTDSFGVNMKGIPIGFDSFIYLFSKGSFFPATIVNTLIIVFISVPASTIIALLIAVALNSIKPLQKVFQTIFFLPYVTNVLAVGMVFNVLFQSPGQSGLAQNGIINAIFNLGNYNWLDLGASLWSWRSVVLIYSIWNGLAFKVLVFIGGLQNISKQYYDAAKIDSTPPRRVLTKITIPLLMPMISYILITSFIGAFKAYESVLGLFSNLQQFAITIFDQRNTMVGFTYRMIGYSYDKSRLVANTPQYYSLGAAAAVILLGIILIFTWVNMKISNRFSHH